MPDNYGWKRDCDEYISVMMTLPPAPEAPLQPDRMGFMSVCEISRCKGKANHLYCTDLCCCGAEEDPCKIVSEQYAYCGWPWPAAYINFNQNIHQIQVLTKPLCRAQAIFYSLPNNE